MYRQQRLPFRIGDAMLLRAGSGSRSEAHGFKSAGQFIIRVSVSVMDWGSTVFITNLLPSAETVYAPLPPLTVVALNNACGVPGCRLLDPNKKRRIRLRKEHSLSTVVWNPWSEGAARSQDLGDGERRQFLCVEASNILDVAINLAPGQEHRMATAERF
jgi:hypothetical protein